MVFCGVCSEQTIALPELGFTDPVRVCDHCYEYQHLKDVVIPTQIPILLAGQVFKKHGRKGFPHSRLIRLSDDRARISWAKSSDDKVAGALEIGNVTSISEGCTTAVFDRCSSKDDSELQARCFSIVADRTLDLEAPTAEVQRTWVRALTLTLDYLKKATPEEKRAEVDAHIAKSETRAAKVNDLEERKRAREERKAKLQAMRK